MTDKRKRPSGENTNKKIKMMRRASSAAQDTHTIGGNLKKGGYAPRPITLPTVKLREPAGS